MKEVEVKIIDIDVNQIKEKVIINNAVLIKKEEQENYFFDLPINNSEGYIRIRKSKNLLDGQESTIITIKKIVSKDEVRIANETDLSINCVEDGINFLNELGLNLTKKALKYRESYILNNVIIEFDTWNKEEFPEPYIELEGDKEAIFNLAKLLEINPSKITSKSLNEIKKEKGYL